MKTLCLFYYSSITITHLFKCKCITQLPIYSMTHLFRCKCIPPTNISYKTFQSRKRLYNHQCLFVCPFVRLSAKPLNSLTSSSFIIQPLSFIILHSSFIILHSYFLHFATFKLFSLFFLTASLMTFIHTGWVLVLKLYL